ncbi:hypothetical protein Ae168Ps1_1991c [Pseudonocardia sp. Ae168_Ps1]|nr:hypothetical protein Ae168Ps1_1991c [Pseudonocardia sp. Ae168_Ps1]
MCGGSSRTSLTVSGISMGGYSINVGRRYWEAAYSDTAILTSDQASRARTIRAFGISERKVGFERMLSPRMIDRGVPASTAAKSGAGVTVDPMTTTASGLVRRNSMSQGTSWASDWRVRNAPVKVRCRTPIHHWQGWTITSAPGSRSRINRSMGPLRGIDTVTWSPHRTAAEARATSVRSAPAVVDE